MSNIRCNVLHRFLAAILAVVMVFSMLPFTFSVNAATDEYPEVFTIKVTDGKNPLKAATVRVYNDSDDLVIAADPADPESQDRDYRFSYDDLKTDGNGVVAIEEITELSSKLEAEGINSFVVYYEIKMTDYEDVKGSIEVTPENASSLCVDVELVSMLITDVTVSGLSHVYDGTEKKLVSVTAFDGDIVTYSVDGAEATTEIPVATDVCEHEIVVTVKREGKTTLVKTVTGKIAPADITDISIEGSNLFYNEEEQVLAILNGAFKDGDIVTWTVNGETVVSFDIPKKMAVGAYLITLTVERENYNKFVSQTIISTIAASDLDLGDLIVKALEGVYKEENGVPVFQPTVSVENKGDYDLKYQLDDGDAEVDDNAWVDEIPTISEAGSYIVWVKAVKEGYNDAGVEVIPAVSAVTPYNVYIAKADQKFDFDEYDAMEDSSAPEKIKLEGKLPCKKEYDFSATDTLALAGGKITYKIESDQDGIAFIDADTGVLTIDYPGAITVIATLSGNSNYNDCVIRYYLDISAEISSQGDYIRFEESEIDYILGTSDVISEQLAAKNDVRIQGEITYSMNTVAGVTMDAATGKVIVSDYKKLADAIREANGSLDIVVKATKAATKRYGVDTASYTITIVFETAPDIAYTLPETDGMNGWYVSDVAVTPAEGYVIAKDIYEVFETQTVFGDQGINDRFVYLKNTVTGGMTDKIAVLDSEGNKLAIDTVKPNAANMNIEFSKPLWSEQLVRVLSLGFYNPSVTITFTAKDATSGIDHFNWTYIKTEGSSMVNADNIRDEWIDVIVSDGIASAVLTLPASEAMQMNGKISFTATDTAGNVSESRASDYVFVVDTINPTISIKYQGNAPYTGAQATIGNIHYFDGDVAVELNVNEANFYAEDMIVQISKDGADFISVVPEWNSNSADEHIGTFIIVGDGDYIVKITYKDRSGNAMESYESEIITIDTVDPEIKMDYEHDGDIQKVIFTVIEHNFRANDITVANSSVFVDINGNPISITADELTSILRAADWEQDENDTNKYTFVFEDLPNGRYDIKLDYTDIVGRTAETFEADDFIVDHDAPANVTIEYLTTPLETFASMITFGFYNPSVEVRFTAYDTSAGVKHFTWSYIKAKDASDGQTEDIPASEQTTVVAVQDSADKSKYTATVLLSAEQYGQLKGNLAVYATDDFDNASETVIDSGKIVVVDTIAPTISVTYTPFDNYVESKNNYYYHNDVEVTLTVYESNFFADDVIVKVSKDGDVAEDVLPVWVDNNADEHIGKFTLSGDGDYVIIVEYMDKSQNEMNTYTSDVHTIDMILPSIQFEFDQALQKTTFTITEHNFYADGITVEGNIKDITGRNSAFSSSQLTEVLRTAEWIRDGDVHTFVYDYLPEGSWANGIYDLKILVSDLAVNKNDLEPETFIIDHDAPTGVSISYSQSIMDTVLETLTLGFYNPDITITFTAYDYASGVNTFTWNYTKEEGASNINRDTDESDTIIKAQQDVQDLSKFTASITLPEKQAEQLRGYFSVVATDEYSNASEKMEDRNNVIVVDTIAPNIQVSYSVPVITIGNTHYYNGNIMAVFTVTESNFFAEDVKVSISKDGSAAQGVTPTWVEDGDDVYIGNYTITGDGDYKVMVEYKDRSNNTMRSYTSDILTIDTIAPVIEFVFDQTSQSTKFIVTEHNFRASDITVTGDIGDITGTAIQHTGNTITDILRKAEWTQDGDTYTYVYNYGVGSGYANGIYDLTISYTDISENSASIEPETFIIDHDAPTGVEIAYSKSIMDTLMQALTLGFYNPDVTITFTAYDFASGVKSFAFDYTKEESASDVNRDTDRTKTVLQAMQDMDNPSKFTASVTLPADEAEQLRGYISVVATDVYNNSADELTDDYIVIVDTISPTMIVEYNAPDRVVGNINYYNGDIDITFTVTEANFFAEDVYVTVSKDGGAAKRITPLWTDENVNTHIGKYTLTGDGDYVVTVTYKDRSDNEMVQYVSDILTIDTILPVIKVDYQNKDVINEISDRDHHQRKYYDDTQTVVVTITEHNFNANEVAFIMNATDVEGNALDINSLHFKDANWISNGDIHTLTITFTGDANYSFDVAYTDLATNAAENYQVDYFTVDKTAPENIHVTYSASLLETVLESITFGFYNAKMTVTISADDHVSGVYGFVYSYLNADGVSNVNAELINQSVSASDIDYTNGGKTATISFEIPKLILEEDEQFNGTVSFTVSDRAGNTAEQSEDKRIVLDNIAPTAQVTYNEAINVEGDISYYDGDINVTVTIHEANFYSDDVQVLVSKNGEEAVSVAPVWTDSGVDVHIGTFTLTEDGDYVIIINYKDKSSNQMTEYVSKQMTIDTVIEAPSYIINGVEKEEIGGAYKNDATIEFNFADQNFDINTIQLTKTRFDKFEDVTDQFITVTDTETGGFGTFSIPKEVENDGVYLLTITMSDKAKHHIEAQIKFTMNRYGSVYEYSDALVSLIKDGGQYVTSVDDDLVIIEYNADKILEGSANVLITRDGQAISADYSTAPEKIDSNVNVGESGWYEYIYTINPSNFAEDGVYKITITSKYRTDDAESNDSVSIPENSIDAEGNQIVDTMSFTVDDTVPEIRNIVNLEKAIINAQAIDVKFTIVDVGGLAVIEIILNGETIDTITSFGDSRLNYSGQFTINESTDAQTVQIKVTDLAGNMTDTASETFTTGELYVFNDMVTVSTNIFVRWYANKPLFWGSIAGIAVIAAAACIVVAIQRKKNKRTMSA